MMKTLVEHNRNKQALQIGIVGEKAGVLCPMCKTEMIYSKAGYNKNAKGYYVFCPNTEDCMENEDWVFVGIKL